jgi:putative phosphoesterase
MCRFFLYIIPILISKCNRNFNVDFFYSLCDNRKKLLGVDFMKLMFASDIHGSAADAGIIIEKFKQSKADKLVLCGDLLYHGPRNDLPVDYKPKKVIELLNSISDDIIAVRGNCDAEVDQMVLEFPIMADYVMLYDDKIRMYITHGHIYNPENPMKLKKGDVLICGHTHILLAQIKDNFYSLNPGSAALPKEGNPKTYMIYENKKFIIKTFDDKVIAEIEIEK